MIKDSKSGGDLSILAVDCLIGNVKERNSVVCFIVGRFAASKLYPQQRQKMVQRIAKNVCAVLTGMILDSKFFNLKRGSLHDWSLVRKICA